ncbi:SDR family NAD(P)-dependent oxidoreductase, partial [Streptomyces sp. SID11233]|nr:SDR family NAD(P)-dependent oxidoreductase [Streptomyces sp. SID11233]
MTENNTTTGRYAGKKVVIVGGSSGFGLATARELIAGGARVLITGRTRATLDAARAELGERAVAVRGDASVTVDVEALADRVKAEFGTVDALYVSAGINGFAPFEATSEELFDKLLTINARGPYFTVQKLVPLLAEGAGIVLTTSVANVL